MKVHIELEAGDKLSDLEKIIIDSDKAAPPYPQGGHLAKASEGASPPPSSPSAILDHIRMGTPLPDDDAMDAPVSKNQSDVKAQASMSCKTGDWNDFAPPSRRNPLGQLRFGQIVDDLEIELAGRTNTLEETKKVYAQLLQQSQERVDYLEKANEELRKKLNHFTDAYDDLKERRDRACNILRK